MSNSRSAIYRMPYWARLYIFSFSCQYFLTWWLTSIGGRGSAYCDVLNRMNVRHQKFLVPDIHAMQYVTVRAAVLNIIGIQNNINESNYKFSADKISGTIVELKFSYNCARIEHVRIIRHHMPNFLKCSKGLKTPMSSERVLVSPHLIRMSPQIFFWLGTVPIYLQKSRRVSFLKSCKRTILLLKSSQQQKDNMVHD